MEVSTTLTPATVPTESDTLKRSKIPYQNAVGALIYLTQATRPDLAYAVSNDSRFNNCYDTHHWDAVKRIIRYLKKTKDICLQYSRDADQRLTGYSDTSWAADPNDPRSVSGYIFLLQGGAVSWNSKRQKTTALSSTKAEYLALTTASQEAIWLKNFTTELEMQPQRPCLIYTDNKGSIDLCKNARFSHRTKHINVRHDFLKGIVDNYEIEVQHVPADKMTADPLTKATPSPRLLKFIEDVGLKVKCSDK